MFALSQRACCSRFAEMMTGAGIQFETVELLQFFYPLETLGRKRALSVKGMEHDAFQQVAKGHVVVFRECFEDLEDPLFHAHPGLDALHKDFGFFSHMLPPSAWYQCTKVPEYMQRKHRFFYANQSGDERGLRSFVRHASEYPGDCGVRSDELKIKRSRAEAQTAGGTLRRPRASGPSTRAASIRTGLGARWSTCSKSSPRFRKDPSDLRLWAA